MVGDEVHDDAQAAGVGGGDEFVEVRQCAEQRIDVAVVGNVVAVIGLWTHQHRSQPDRVHAEGHEVVETVDDAAQVADAVRVAVGEGSGVDLVDHCMPPPLGRCGGHSPVKVSPPNLACNRSSVSSALTAMPPTAYIRVSRAMSSPCSR